MDKWRWIESSGRRDLGERSNVLVVVWPVGVSLFDCDNRAGEHKDSSPMPLDVTQMMSARSLDRGVSLR